MPAVSDAELVRRARAAIAVGDMDTAKRAAAELWARHQRQAFLASRGVARGDERDEVLGHIGIRFTRWVYHGKDEPRNMAGLISQMAHYAAGDVTRKEAGEAPTKPNRAATWPLASDASWISTMGPRWLMPPPDQPASRQKAVG